MNIPEVTNEMRQGLRSESAVSVQAVDKAKMPEEPKSVSPEAVQKQDRADNEKPPMSNEQLLDLVAEAQEQLEKSDVSLKFNVIEENDTVQVEIVDSDGKTIRKIPGDDLLKLSKSLKNLDRGFLDEMS